MEEHLIRPSMNDREAWKSYWKQHGQPWRTEPEIDVNRQIFLVERLTIQPDFERGIYPFRDITLNRADVEWLLAEHNDGSGFIGPIDWSEENQRKRIGLDLRGADLREQDLSELPLACLCGGLDSDEWDKATLEQRDSSRINLERAKLAKTLLQGANLNGALIKGATVYEAHLERASLGSAHLEEAQLKNSYLEGARVRGTYFDITTNLAYIHLVNAVDGPVFVGEVRWGGVNLTSIDWEQLEELAEDLEACRTRNSDGKRKERALHLQQCEDAVRANRQLAIELRAQGLNEEADKFSYRAHVIQRRILRMQDPPRWRKYIGSILLNAVAGYGFRLERCALIYLTAIFSFAILYYLLGPIAKVPLSPLGALVFSMTSFHGRGFFPGGNPIKIDGLLTVLAAFEALVGLIVEVSFIATFTQRFFNR